MTPAALIARLKAELTGVRSVGGAADLDAAMEATVATPAVYVITLAETAGASPYVAGTVQRITQQFGVLSVVNNRRDGAGQAAMDDLTTLRTAIRAALLGWVPDEATASAVQFSGGRLMRFEEGRLWWVDQFQVETYYRATNT